MDVVGLDAFGFVTAGVEALRTGPLGGLEVGAPSLRGALTCVFSIVPEALRLRAVFSGAPFAGVVGREVGFCAGLGAGLGETTVDRWTGEGAEGAGALVGSICEMRSLKSWIGQSSRLTFLQRCTHNHGGQLD